MIIAQRAELSQLRQHGRSYVNPDNWKKVRIIRSRNPNVLQNLLGGEEVCWHRKRDYGLAMCPSHFDTMPNLKIWQDETGATLVACRCGCTPSEVVAALRLRGLHLARVWFTWLEPLKWVKSTRPTKTKGSKKKKAT
jgi:hypothetical protein